jgi:tetratricopeptide (TPR) repeat protein
LSFKLGAIATTSGDAMAPIANSLGSEENTQRREATNFFMEARLALKNNESARAEKLLRRALALWPENYNYTLQLAKVAIQVSRNSSEIEDLLQTSSNLNPIATEPRILLANQYEKLGELDKAVAIYKSVLNIDPNNLIVRRRFGHLNIDMSLGMSMKSFMGHYGAEAAVQPDSMVTDSVNEPVSEAHSQEKDQTSSVKFQGHIPSTEPTFYLEPEQEKIDKKASEMQMPSDELDETLLETRQFGSLMPELENMISEGEYGWDSLVEAIQHDSQMIEIDGQMRLNVGISYIDLGMHDAAIEELEEAYHLFMRKGEEGVLRCCRLLVDCTLALGQYEKAAQWCERALELGGRDNEAGHVYLDELAGIYKRLGNNELSAQLYAELNILSPGYHNIASIGTQMDLASELGEENQDGRYALRPISGISGDDYIFDEDETEIAIGRSENSDMIIDSLRVSKEHARLTFTEGGNFIISLSKTNGTYLNGQRLELGREYPLIVGDRIGLGKSIELQFIDRLNL